MRKTDEASAESVSEPALQVRVPARSGLRASLLLGAALLLVLVTRWPLLPAQLYSFDTVNLALALEEFDPNLNQPQPPGYPLFVLEARLLHPLFGSPERTFAAIQILISALCLVLLYALGKRMFSAYAGLVAAALLLVNPAFWYSGLTSPLRPHLALFALLITYLLWRTRDGEPRYFYLCSAVLGLAGGFRPELSVVLLPLWAWVGWQCGRFRLLLRGGGLYVLAITVWVVSLVILSGGPAHLLLTFREYLSAQTFQTSPLAAVFPPGWRRMLGRAILWNGLGILPVIWTIPFGWLRREQWAHWRPALMFLLLWFFPAFLFSVIVHIADPDHALVTVPVVCLVAGACIGTAEQSLAGPWIAWLKRHWLVPWLLLSFTGFLLYATARLSAVQFVIWVAASISLLFLVPFGPFPRRGAVACLALLANILLFFGRFPFPQGPAAGGFRGLASMKDAFLGATYESSYNRVQWTAETTASMVEHIPRLKLSTSRPLLLIWSRDGTPVWRITAYYFPAERIHALDEQGDPGVPVSQARLWSGKTALARYTGDAPIQLPVPKGARLVWFVAGDRLRDLPKVVPVQRSPVLYYSDLPNDFPPFRWGSFEFVPQ